jgi:acetyl esterase/lipase
MDIPYGADILQKIDFYPAAHPPPRRLVVYLHGGGWVTGNRRGGRQLAAPFNQAGYSLACVGYRLLPQTDLAGCISDVARAIGHLLARAAEFGIEPGGCVVMGHSAGAHMGALLATDRRHLLAAGADPACLGAVVALDGVFDVTAYLQDSTRPMLRRIFGDDAATWRLYSPVEHVGAMQADPKFCLMHEDVNARFGRQVGLFEAALRRHGKAVVSAVAHGLTHAELILFFKHADQPMARFVLGNIG